MRPTQDSFVRHLIRERMQNARYHPLWNVSQLTFIVLTLNQIKMQLLPTSRMRPLTSSRIVHSATLHFTRNQRETRKLNYQLWKLGFWECKKCDMSPQWSYLISSNKYHLADCSVGVFLGKDKFFVILLDWYYFRLTQILGNLGIFDDQRNIDS